MTIVVDASIVVAALVDTGPVGTWAEHVIETEDLAAPHLMSVEVANILRRASQSGEISLDTASLAHADLLALSVVYFPYEPFGARVWELRDNVTSYDAWYVALAEHLGAPMATLDQKLAKAPGVRCGFRVPPNGE